MKSETKRFWLLCVSYALLAALFFSGCGASRYAIAAQTAATVATLNGEAAKILDRLDEDKFMDVSKEYGKTGDHLKAEKDFNAWDEKATKAKQGILIVNAGVQSTREAIRLAKAGGKVDLGKELGELLKVWASLREVFGAFGISLPNGGL